MFDEFEDLESMRRRIRDEARQRREEELRLRREKREASSRRRRSSLVASSSSSSSSNRDLLPSSSPSPPPVGRAASSCSFSANTSASNKLATRKSREGVKAKAEDDLAMPNSPHITTCLGSKKKQHANATLKQNKTSRIDFDESDSEDDLADLSRRLAERNKTRGMEQSKGKTKNACKNNKTTLNSSKWWSDDDSEEEMDIRKVIAREAAKKRKREADIEAMSKIEKVESNKAISSQEGGIECTPKISNEIKADKKSLTSLQNYAKSTSKLQSFSNTSTAQNTDNAANSVYSISSNLKSNLQPASLIQKTASPSQEGYKIESKMLVRAATLLQQSPKLVDGCTQEGKLHTTNPALHSTATVKSTIASATAGSIAASMKLVGKSKQRVGGTQEEGNQHRTNPTLHSAIKSTVVPATAGSTAASTKRVGKSKLRDGSTQEGKYRTTNPALHSTTSAAAGSLAALTKLPSQKTLSLQEMPSSANSDTDPIVGKEVRTRSNVDWTSHKQCLLVRTVGSCSPKDKVAGFDLDQTLVQWRCAGWPSRPEHYELWSSAVIEKCRQLHDNGYKLVVFSNQGGIKNALNGKKAGTVKGIIDWIAKLVDRPLFAVCSTKKSSGYHKGESAMWEVMENYCNCGKQVRPDLSFFVGDADGTGVETASLQQQQHQQSGTDKLFAAKVGMEFHTPGEYFGPSNADRRRTMTSNDAPPALSQQAIRSRTALLGGYLSGPILLILIGVQGSGKSSFSQSLIDNSCGRWCQFSQDTIRNGQPGTRQEVETAAKEAIRNGKNVVIDRMHLDAEQRNHFLQLGKLCRVPVHGLVLMASKEEVEDRVKRRVNHPGKVEGDNGARIAVASLSRLVPPKYDEGFALISYTHQIEGKMVEAYRRVNSKGSDEVHAPRTIELYNAGKFTLPMVTLGTMLLRKQETTTVVTQAMQMGLASVDTAPTYGNESEVGDALINNDHIKLTIKIPKRVTSSEQARKEVMKSLSLLGRSRVDIILLHWPCDFIETNTLSAVWKELEAMKKDGICDCIGVSNFAIMALKILLSCCAIKPALNQVERHPLLPQYDLLEYCDSNDIIVQAHSPLANGSELLLGNSTIVRIAEESEMSPAQVLLGWQLQQNVPVVTKFSLGNHGKEIIALLQKGSKLRLSPQQMNAIDDLSLSGESRRFVAPPFMYRRGAAYSWGDAPS